MQIPVIKQLVENCTIPQLQAAEEALLAEEALPVEIAGQDEGEQLTHALAARWILERMQESGLDFKEALRQYTRKVRETIN